MISDLETSTNPFMLFGEWFEAARTHEINDANAMTLATIDEYGLPNARIVLLKDFAQSGFVFYTNTLSVKGRELAHHPRAALVFHWKSLLKQVRIRGEIVIVSHEEADAYYASRPYLSRIGAHASLQSTPLDHRETFEQRIEMLKSQYPEGTVVPRPTHWSGYRLVPIEIEFWADRPFRLHDRMLFTRESETDAWKRVRLYP
jgi:pyridoxamine 5'-phosphate oxidase